MKLPHSKLEFEVTLSDTVTVSGRLILHDHDFHPEQVKLIKDFTATMLDELYEDPQQIALAFTDNIP